MFKTLKMINIDNTSCFTPETIVVLSSRCTRFPISVPQGAKIRLGVGSEAQRGVKIRKMRISEDLEYLGRLKSTYQ